ncbi:MAG: hypothetical protein IKN38_04075, partial [Clostridia bacterium]|nr:hypothetical protein [Clostridia bacterium]
MSIVSLAVGIVFLLNPCVWLWDVLPDFIGAAIIIFGIRKIAFMSDATEKIFNGAWKVALISVIKCALGIILYGTPGMTKLLLSFIFTVAELAFAVRLISDLFSTLDILQIRYKSTDGATSP